MNDKKKGLNESYNGQKSDRGNRPLSDNGQRPTSAKPPPKPTPKR